MAVSRRDALLGLGVAAAAVPLPAFAAPQLKECPKGVQNCYSTASGTIATWTWPKSSTKAQAIKDIEAVLDSYPQTGQAVRARQIPRARRHQESIPLRGSHPVVRHPRRYP